MKKKKTAQERFNEYVKLCKKNKKLVKKAYKILSWESEWDLESPEQLRSLDLKKIDRFKKLYFINYRKYYKIDKVLNKC